MVACNRGCTTDPKLPIPKDCFNNSNHAVLAQILDCMAATINVGFLMDTGSLLNPNPTMVEENLVKAYNANYIVMEENTIKVYNANYTMEFKCIASKFHVVRC